MFITTRRVAGIDMPEEIHKAHEDHVSSFSKTVMSGNILDENGEMLKVVSISGHETWDAINHYVHEDPYTKAGAYAEIEIQELNVYLLDAGYARAPEWFLERHPDLAPRFTPVKREGRR